MSIRKWNPTLHPRGRGGLFARRGSGSSPAEKAARKAAGAPADADQAKIRRKAQRRAGFRAASGVVNSGLYIGVGHYTGNTKYTAAGVGRLAATGYEAHHNFSSAKRVTSKEFHKLPQAQRNKEEAQRARKSALIGLGLNVADSGIARRGGEAVGKEFIRRRIDRASTNEWNAQAASDPAEPFRRAQGPAPWKAKAAGTSRLRRNRGVYDITSSSKIGKKARVATGRSRTGNATNQARSAAARAASSARSARANARNRAYKARGGTGAVVLRRGTTAVARPTVIRR